MVCAAIADIKRNYRKNALKLAKTAFARCAARCLRPKDRTEYTAQTLVDRKPTDKALRIGKCAF